MLLLSPIFKILRSLRVYSVFKLGKTCLLLITGEFYFPLLSMCYIPLFKSYIIVFTNLVRLLYFGTHNFIIVNICTYKPTIEMY